MKHFFKLLLFIPLVSFAQLNLEQELDSIATPEAAETFIKTYKSSKGKLFTFNKAKHKTRLADDLFKLSIGGKKVIKSNYKKTYYKIIDKAAVDYYKFDIIVIDASDISDEEALAKRDNVLAKYNEGYRFKDLAKHNSTGPTAKTKGDTGWIKKGDMSEAFDAIAINESHKKDHIFSVNDPKNKKYYLVLKTENRTPIEEITVLKFTEEIE